MERPGRKRMSRLQQSPYPSHPRPSMPRQIFVDPDTGEPKKIFFEKRIEKDLRQEWEQLVTVRVLVDLFNNLKLILRGRGMAERL